ncbi:MAG: phosphate/phosphite/phosphonate ABC transporter substrate-binding protein [Chloroflexi bacterium]|nr:phosphate/phosphite/phosphonate ABC transporter substrate-binding protein [Chloroflexota bacterium]MBV9134822.1 phosphate/phosphite/phosphonate ABC transporter substrate-binding protein [Chloroflexota bacterium]MBV9897889.1 phosphate/phosphite/phosphonate ABC transporter substrate-binding protein [Chloroflexota bacterium]
MVAPATTIANAQTSNAACPNGTLTFGVEPYEDAAVLAPAYQPLSDALGKTLGCTIQLNITSNYTAEIEAMRNDKLDIAEFGPLAYVFAQKLANAEIVATFSDSDGNPATYTASITTWPGSGITDISQVGGHSFAYSDPASTSGHLYPAFGLKQNGIDPDTGVQAVYAGSHTSSFEALRNHKVDAGELNSDQISAATAAGEYSPEQFVTLWQSEPIPQDPITVRSTLPPDAKQKIKAALLAFDFTSLPDDVQKMFNSDVGMEGTHMVADSDSYFDEIRSLVSTLNIDLNSLG